MVTRRTRRLPDPASGAAGHVTIDSRGHNVWQWNDDQLDSTTMMLASLENDALALEPTRTLEQPTLPEASKPTPRPKPTPTTRPTPTLSLPAIDPTRSLRQLTPQPRSKQSRSEESSLLDIFDASDLSIEQTINIRLGGGFDPYNRT